LPIYSFDDPSKGKHQVSLLKTAPDSQKPKITTLKLAFCRLCYGGNYIAISSHFNPLCALCNFYC